MLILGIDESGRGPVIGPLVIVGVLATEAQIQKMAEMGVKDSKLLTPVQRERRAEKILQTITDYKTIVVNPDEIDEIVNESTKLNNLNWLEADKSAEIINELKPETVVIDCPSPICHKYTSYIRDRLKVKPNMIVEHKADANHVIVGAASIIAKVTRDELIQEIKKKHKVEFGSGYPSDPMTKAFLEKHWDKFDFFRKSWDSYKQVKNSKGQTKLS